MDKRPLILGIGEIVWDCLPSGSKLGGAPVNFAFYAQQLGCQGIPVSAIGIDALANDTIEACKVSGIDTSYIQCNTLPTSRVLVSVDDNGVPQYEIVRDVAWDAIVCEERDLELVAGASAICWGSLACRSEISRKSIFTMIDASPETCLKVFDINIRQKFYNSELIKESLLRADVLKLNEDELPIVADLFSLVGSEEEVSRRLCADYSIKYLIYTKGGDSSEIYSKDGRLSYIPTPKVVVRDTVGAGDSFTAAFLSYLIKGFDIKTCHQRAVEIAAFVCTQDGAINPLPESIKL